MESNDKPRKSMQTSLLHYFGSNAEESHQNEEDNKSDEEDVKL